MELLPIYVEDHLALALGGLRLARRCRDENRGTSLAAVLDDLLPELQDDQAALSRALRALGGRPSLVKELAITAGELVGRFKPNGRLLGYSPLSRVWELEALVAGSSSRRAAFTVLARAEGLDPRLAGSGFDARAVRAGVHADTLERARLRAAAEVLSGSG
ncbi:MAG: hypothetical protein QM704_06095 [Anaeromyxobacteraceae bacterium]